jgi:hypothetical protein
MYNVRTTKVRISVIGPAYFGVHSKARALLPRAKITKNKISRTTEVRLEEVIVIPLTFEVVKAVEPSYEMMRGNLGLLAMYIRQLASKPVET